MNIARIIAAGSLAVGLAGIASAAVNNPGNPYIIHVSGSTAFRSQYTTGEISALTAGLTVANGFGVGTVPGTGTYKAAFSVKDTYTCVHGVDANNNEIIFLNHWTGSVAGLVDLAQANSIAFIPVASVPAINVQALNLPTTENAISLMAMADCAAADGATTCNSSGGNAAAKTAGAAITASGMTDAGVQAAVAGFVSTVDFEWAMGANSAAAPAITNVTQDNAEALLSGGVIPAQYLTGNGANNATAVFYVGRNEDSGTRVLYQAESWAYGTGSSVGLGATTKQYMIKQAVAGYPANVGYSSLSAEAGNITDFKIWPGNWGMNTKAAISWAIPGHSGYNGGGDVEAVLQSPNPVAALPSTGGFTSPITGNPYTAQVFLTCIGTADAASLFTAAPAGTALTYNGVTYHKSNIENGTYALFNFEHSYYITGGTAANSLAVVANGAQIKLALDTAADAVYNSGLGVADTDAGICGNIAVGFPAILNRGKTAGSYIH
jgi:hypothetical protein